MKQKILTIEQKVESGKLYDYLSLDAVMRAVLPGLKEKARKWVEDRSWANNKDLAVLLNFLEEMEEKYAKTIRPRQP